ncbi:MAG: TonB-dependent siderophore receptor [Alcaligenes pakistanensis]
MLDTQAKPTASARRGTTLIGLNALALSLFLAFGLHAPHAQAQEAPVAISIAAQPLAAALEKLGAQAGLQIFYLPEAVKGINAPSVSGSLTADQALSRLLAGTGLEFRRNGKNVSLSRPVQGETTQLAPVRVVGRELSTEGSGSYTVQATAAATGLRLSPRETPQSVSVVTRQQLDDMNLTKLGDTFRTVTGIATTMSDIDRTDIYSRGFFVDNYQYDGVPVETKNDFFGTSNFDPVLYDRIEIVRGATGLMTGAGNPGASVNMVRKRASSDVFTGSASVGVGSWDHHRGTIDLSTPLNKDGTVRARVAGMMEERDSYIDRYHTRNRAWLATAEADLTPDTTVRVGVEHQAKRPTGVTWGGLPTLDSNGQDLDWRRSFSIGADWTNWNTTSNTFYAGLDHRFENGWSLKATVSRLESKYDSKLIYLMGHPNPITGQGMSTMLNNSYQELDQNSGSLEVSGPFNAFGQEHEAFVGLMGSKAIYRYGSQPPLGNSPVGNIFQWDGSYPEPAWGEFQALGEQETRQNAVYGALRLSLSDSLKLIVGGRQTNWKRVAGQDTMKHHVFTPYAGLLYDINENFTAYASYTDIFQPQSYRDANGSYLDPVQGKSYELGLKSEHFEGRLNTSLALFRIEQDNVAEQDGDKTVPGTPDFAYRGAKGVTSEGFELQASGEIQPGWQLSAGFSRTLVRNAEGGAFQPFRPQNLAHLQTSYVVPGTEGKLSVGGGLQWRSHIYTDRKVAPNIEARRAQGSIVLANVMAHYRFSSSLSAQLNVNNLFDKKYVDLVSDSQGFYGAPQKIMLTMKYQF